LYTYEGKYVSLMMMDKGLDSVAMFRWVQVLDSCYSYYRSVTGKEPDTLHRTFLNNHTTIAEVNSTCGAGCGYLGFTGIEMLKAYSDRMYNYVLTR
jgi:serralysin